MGLIRRTLTAALIVVGCVGSAVAQVPDALRSWNDGAAKQAISGFVARVTTQGGADFVPPAERIATFDNDGTLWTRAADLLPVRFRDRPREGAGAAAP